MGEEKCNWSYYEIVIEKREKSGKNEREIWKKMRHWQQNWIVSETPGNGKYPSIWDNFIPYILFWAPNLISSLI